jgi:glycosyltransferase involved in cell wall biosynthesis
VKLLIVSHTPHYRAGGTIVGWGPTVREIDHLAGLFREVVHIAPLHEEPAPASALPYESVRVRVKTVRPAGGERHTQKARVFFLAPRWARAILREVADADVVHVRCPASIGLVALSVLQFRRQPRKRWIKYAGNWNPEGTEPLSYRLQRAWLRSGLTRGTVTVNGEWPDQPRHVHPFLNPCLTEMELEEGRCAAAQKTLGDSVNLLFVGRLENEKGAGHAIRVLERLRARAIDAKLDLVGDGPERGTFEALARQLGADDIIRFHGWLKRTVLGTLFSQAHFLLLPTVASEGWPKVLSEAMAYGAVPLAGRVSCISQYLERFRSGRAIPADDEQAFVEAIATYAATPTAWQEESMRAVEAAALFTYSRHVENVRALLDLSSDDEGTTS